MRRSDSRDSYIIDLSSYLWCGCDFRLVVSLFGKKSDIPKQTRQQRKMGCCYKCVKYVLVPLVVLIVVLSSEKGRESYRILTSWPQVFMGLENSAANTLFEIFTFPYLLACLLSGGEDFRRVIFLQHETLAQGQEFYLWNSRGIIGLSYDAVSRDMMDPKQQRGPYFGLKKVGWTPEDDNGGADIPEACMPKNLLLMKSSDDPEHTKFRNILHRAVSGLTKHVDLDLPLLVPDDFPTSLDGSDIDLDAYVLKVVGMNIIARMFFLTDNGQLQLDRWNPKMADYIVEFQSTVPLCAVGIPGTKGKAPQIKKMMDELNDILARESPVGATIVKLGDEELAAGGADMLAQTVFGSLFAGLGGTFHLTSHAIRRIRSDPGRFVEMYESDPDAFLLEHARLDPPVTSYSSILTHTVDIDVWPFGKVHVKTGTPAQMTLTPGNRDAIVFGGPKKSRAYADTFDHTRENLDLILSWNGVFKDVGLEKSAPRGCPGVDLSRAVAREVIELVLPLVKKERTSAKNAEL